MNRGTFITIILFSVHLIRGQEFEQKCCDRDRVFVQKKYTFFCELNPNPRKQSTFGTVGFANENLPGDCIELLEEKPTVFTIKKSLKIVKKQPANLEFFPKCCPVGQLYNSVFHSCVENDNVSPLPFLTNNSFVSVGLPHCEIISDKILDSVESLQRTEESISFSTTSSTNRRISTGKYCLDATLKGKIVVKICENDLQICSQIRCIRKCCPDGQSFVNGSNCVDTFKYGLDLNATTKIHQPNGSFVTLHGIERPIYRLLAHKYNYWVDWTGGFHSYLNQSNTFEYYGVSNQSYCFEHAYKKGVLNGYEMFSKQVKPPLEMKFAVTRWLKLISCIFLLLTMLVYLCLPRMRNMFGKILLSYCVSTFIFLALLTYSQFSEDFNDDLCRLIGFASVLASIWSFTWLNIMCIDIWTSFGTPRTLAGPLQKNELKRLLQYSLYGWGFPLVWILIIAFFYSNSILPYEIQPYVGQDKCYMENTDTKPGNYAYLLFVVFILLIQQAVNTVLFTKTILYCLKIKAEIKRMNDAKKQTDFNASKEKLGLIMKLAVIMGVSFLFEIVSSIVSFRRNSIMQDIEVFWDSINCLQGVFIFIIFVCKKKIFQQLCEKLPFLRKRKTSLSSTTTTQISLQQISAPKLDKVP